MIGGFVIFSAPANGQNPALSTPPVVSDVVDATTLDGKVMCGYQGWFTCRGDGANLGWVHWAKDRLETPRPGNVTVDLWPDLREFESSNRYPSGFSNADGSPAMLYSSFDREAVDHHFRWMNQYGIDGVFLQRFANGLNSKELVRQKDAVLSHVRAGADRYGRTYAIMYDLSGYRPGTKATDSNGDTDTQHTIDDSVRRDWLRIESENDLGHDPRYLHHRGRPVVGIWGVGFSDGRPYSMEYCAGLIRWFADRGCTVVLGVPSYWRDLERDAVDDPTLHALITAGHVVSPWSVGRYQTPAQAERHIDDVWAKDKAWCDSRGLDFLPVVFPGFSWHNLNPESEPRVIPRLRGEFFWKQIVGAKRIGAKMVYVAMFDEVDEATAIFKCRNDPPVGEGVTFIDYEGLPSDYYLRLTGEAGRFIRGERSAEQPRPGR